MTISTEQPLSPGWWLSRLLQRLGQRQSRIEKLQSYVDNTALIPVGANRAVRESYRRMMALASTNFAELVVEAVRERQQVTGFRTGAQGDRETDDEAWRIWQQNALDADSSLVHRSMLGLADAYVIVGRDPDGKAIITPEDPRFVITEEDPIRRRRSLAGLKAFHSAATQEDVAYLYLPGFVFVARRNAPQVDASADTTQVNYDVGGWEWDASTPQRLPAVVVPVVHFANRPDISGHSSGEFETNLSVLDRINYTILQRLEVVTIQAFRQRGIKGLPKTDGEGNEVDYADIFTSDPGAMWQLPDTAEIWESGLIDLTPILSSIRADIQDLAAVTRTPLFYLTPDAANGSAEGASLAREGLVFKVNDRNTQAGEAWEQVMSLAFTFEGDTVRAQRPDLEVVWQPPEHFSLAERYDAAVKAIAAQVPWRNVMLDVLQFSPTEVARMESARLADALAFGASQTTVPPSTSTTPAAAPPNAGG